MHVQWGLVKCLASIYNCMHALTKCLVPWVSVCMGKEWRGRLSVTKLSSENNLPTFWLNAPVVIGPKVKEVWKNVAIYSHALLRIHITGDQVRWGLLLFPCLLITVVQQPGNSSPPSWLKWCHLDVQGRSIHGTVGFKQINTQRVPLLPVISDVCMVSSGIVVAVMIPRYWRLR